MEIEKKSVEIAGRLFAITGDEYAHIVGTQFESDLVGLIALLCNKDFHALDVGANIGLVTLALSEVCSEGRVAAIEPVSTTFDFLQKNIVESRAKNVKAFNFALGSKPASLLMQGAPSNLSGAFIADKYRIEKGPFATVVEVKTLDEIFSELSLDRLDFMKVDVEGYELEVLEGAQQVLNTHRPTVILEMNHWCLNIFRRVSIPEFRERLMSIFPCIYAIEGANFLDFSNQDNAHYIYHEHLTKFKFANLVAGFEREAILSRLAFFSRCHKFFVEADSAKAQLAVTRRDLDTTRAELRSLQQHLDTIEAELTTGNTDRQVLQAELRSLKQERDSFALRVQQMIGSKSWKLTAPLRVINDAITSALSHKSPSLVGK
jgi:FkbM family methyltransferase